MSFLRRAPRHPHVEELAADLVAHDMAHAAQELRTLPEPFLELVEWTQVLVYRWNDERIPIAIRMKLDLESRENSSPASQRPHSAVMDWCDTDTNLIRGLIVLHPDSKGDLAHEMVHVADHLADPALRKKTFARIAKEGLMIAEEAQVRISNGEPREDFLDLYVGEAIKDLVARNPDATVKARLELRDLFVDHLFWKTYEGTSSLDLVKATPDLHQMRSKVFALAIFNAHAQNLDISKPAISEVIARRYGDCPEEANDLARSALAVAIPGRRIFSDSNPHMASGSEWGRISAESEGRPVPAVKRRKMVPGP